MTGLNARILVLGILLCGVLPGAFADDVSQLFARQIVLTGVPSGMTSAASLTTFSSGFSTVLTQATSLGSFDSAPAAGPTNLTMEFSQFVTGTSDAVTTTLASLSSQFDGWSTTMPTSFVDGTNSLSTSTFSIQPNGFIMLDVCPYSGSQITTPTATSGCYRNLTVFLYSSTSTAASAVSSAVCSAVQLSDCGLVSTTTSVDQTSGGAQYLAVVNIYASSREVVLTRLLNRVMYASSLKSLNVKRATVAGVTVYVQGSAMRLSYEGNFTTCAQHYWYLVFLIIVIPVFLIAAQRCYRRGRRSGRRTIQRAENDIRAGMHMVASPPWRNTGYGGYGAGNPNGAAGVPYMMNPQMNPQMYQQQQQQQAYDPQAYQYQYPQQQQQQQQQYVYPGQQYQDMFSARNE